MKRAIHSNSFFLVLFLLSILTMIYVVIHILDLSQSYQLLSIINIPFLLAITTAILTDSHNDPFIYIYDVNKYWIIALIVAIIPYLIIMASFLFQLDIETMITIDLWKTTALLSGATIAFNSVSYIVINSA